MTDRHMAGPGRGQFAAYGQARSALAHGHTLTGGRLEQKPGIPSGGGMPAGSTEVLQQDFPHHFAGRHPASVSVQCVDLRSPANPGLATQLQHDITPSAARESIQDSHVLPTSAPAMRLPGLVTMDLGKMCGPLLARYTGKAPGER